MVEESFMYMLISGKKM